MKPVSQESEKLSTLSPNAIKIVLFIFNDTSAVFKPLVLRMVKIKRTEHVKTI